MRKQAGRYSKQSQKKKNWIIEEKKRKKITELELKANSKANSGDITQCTYRYNWVYSQTTGYCAGMWWFFRPQVQKPIGKRRSIHPHAESDRRYDDQMPALRDRRNFPVQSL